MTRARIVALACWMGLAVIVWNTIFDHQVETAAHRYIAAATRAARGQGPPVAMAAIMRPAIHHGAWVATAWGLLIVVVGLAGVWYAIWRDRRSSREVQGSR